MLSSLMLLDVPRRRSTDQLVDERRADVGDVLLHDELPIDDEADSCR